MEPGQTFFATFAVAIVVAAGLWGYGACAMAVGEERPGLGEILPMHLATPAPEPGVLERPSTHRVTALRRSSSGQ